MIIVTGGTGFIGSNIVAALEKRGYHDITICDYFGDGDKWRNISKHEIRDIVHPEHLFEYMKKRTDEIQAIFHMGAISSTTEKDVDMIVDSNYRLSRMIWKFCANYDVQLIYASSAATYGDGSAGFKDDETIEGLSRLKPLNAYGWSKHAFDRRVARLVQDRAMRSIERRPKQWVGLKFFNVYGPNEYHKGSQMSVVTQLYPKIKAGESAKLFKSYNPSYDHGGQKRDFVYVKDCVDLMLWFLENPEHSGLYNCGTGQARTYKEVALATFASANMEPKIEYVPMPDQLRGKYQYFTEADMNKVRRIGYTKAFHSLEEGVKDYVQNYLAHEDPYL